MRNYFTEKELESPDVPGSGALMDKDFLKMLNEARHIANTPFIINSGYRSKSHNELISGSKTSSHLKGLAVDIAYKSPLEMLKIVSGAIRAGFKRIGAGRTFIHLDSDNNKPNAYWGY
jgi:uncharacterized protein YcbK (DUF882 family)